MKTKTAIQSEKEFNQGVRRIGRLIQKRNEIEFTDPKFQVLKRDCNEAKRR